MGTELLRSQGPPDDGRPLVWRNEDRPGDVADVHAAHAAAGASLLTTNTLLAPLCAPADGERLARLGVAIARRFGLPVALSLGPGAANPTVYGTLASSGADLVLLETFSEAAAAAEAVRSVRAASPSLPVAALLVFAGDGRTLSCRTAAAAAAALLLDAGADAVGANCAPPDGLPTAVAALHAALPPAVPLILRPSAGIPCRIGEVEAYPWAAPPWAAAVRALAADAAPGRPTLLGGCCGATPAHIAALAAALSAL